MGHWYVWDPGVGVSMYDAVEDARSAADEATQAGSGSVEWGECVPLEHAFGGWLVPVRSPAVNPLVEHAARDGRGYVTPEDIGEILTVAPERRVEIAMALLRIIGRIDGAGAEDASLCAFVAAKDRRS